MLLQGIHHIVFEFVLILIFNGLLAVIIMHSLVLLLTWLLDGQQIGINLIKVSWIVIAFAVQIWIKLLLFLLFIY